MIMRGKSVHPLKVRALQNCRQRAMYEAQLAQEASDEASLATGQSAVSDQPQTSVEPAGTAPETPRRDIGLSDGEDHQVSFPLIC